MTIEFKLDTHAVETLFPEGTEARVKLQQAVIEEFTRRHIKSMINGVVDDPYLTRVVEEAKTKLLSDYFIADKESGWNKNYKMMLTPKHKDAIQFDISRMVNDQVQEALKAEMANSERWISATLRHNISVEVNRFANTEIKKLLAERMAKSWEDMATKLKTHIGE